jgi:hypothetical protein
VHPTPPNPYTHTLTHTLFHTHSYTHPLTPPDRQQVEHHPHRTHDLLQVCLCVYACVCVCLCVCMLVCMLVCLFPLIPYALPLISYTLYPLHPYTHPHRTHDLLQRGSRGHAGAAGYPGQGGEQDTGMYVFMYVCVYVCVSVCLYVCMLVCLYAGCSNTLCSASYLIYSIPPTPIHPYTHIPDTYIQTRIKIGLNSKMPSRFPPVVFYW